MMGREKWEEIAKEDCLSGGTFEQEVSGYNFRAELERIDVQEHCVCLSLNNLEQQTATGWEVIVPKTDVCFSLNVSPGTLGDGTVVFEDDAVGSIILSPCWAEETQPPHNAFDAIEPEWRGVA